MRECFELKFTDGPSFEVPALVLSALVRPGVREAERRDQLYVSLCVWFVRERCARDPDWARTPIEIAPIFLTQSERAIAADLRTVELRLKQRLAAGRAANAYLMEAESGATPQPPEGVARLSLNELSHLIAQDLDLSTTENVEARVWRPSLPVIHLAAAWNLTLQEALRDTGRLPMLEDLYSDPGLLRLVLARAEHNVPLLAESRLRILPEKLIRFRMTE